MPDQKILLRSTSSCVGILLRNPSYLSGPGYYVVLDRSAGLLLGVRDVVEILIASDTIRVGKGFIQ